MSKTKSTSLRTVKTGQAEIDRQLDEEYAKTAVAWWDVRRPEVYFGIKGERTDEQKELARRFRQEWGNVKGGAVLNGLVDGTYTADQVTDYWGAENFNSIIKSEGYQTEEFTGSADEFGAYLASQWDNVSDFLSSTTIGPDGTLGSLSTTPLQNLGGSRGNERGVRVTSDRLVQQEYVNAVKAAADQAGIPVSVLSPDGAQYELNYGQFDDVALGEYKQTVEPFDTIDKIGRVVSSVLEAVLIAGVTGEITSALATLASGVQAAGGAAEITNGVLSFSDAVATADQTKDFLDTALEVVSIYRDVSSVAGEIEEALDLISEVKNTISPDETIPEDVVVSLEADPELMGEEKIMESEGLEPETVTGTSNRITDPVGSVGTAEDSFLNEDFISEAFENRRYSDATPEEIQAIVDSVEEEWGDSWDRLSDQSKELEITGRINDYVRDNIVNIKDLYRIFQAELGRRPTTEEINDILGGTKGTIKGTDDIVTEYIDSTLPVGETTVTETIGEEDFTTDPLPVPDTTPDAVKIQDVGFEVTEPAVNVEIDPYIPEQPTTDATGGGASEESAEAAAVTEPTDAEAALEEAVAETGGVVTTQGGDAGQTSPVISDDTGEVTTSDRPFWIIRDGVVYIRDIDNIDEWLPATNIPDWLPTEDGVYGQSGEQIDEDEEDILGTPTTIPSTSTEVVEEPDTTVVDVLTGNSTETVDELITDILTDTVVNQGTENVVVETNGTTTGGTETGGTTTGGTDTNSTTTGGTDTGDAEVGDAEVGDAEVGDGNENGDGDGDKDGDDSGDGVLGLGGSGLLSIESPSIFEPNYQPLSYNTELLKPRMFDFIDYNPLRTRR